MKTHMIKKISLLLVLMIILIYPVNIYAENLHQDLIGKNQKAIEEEIREEIEIARQEIYSQLKEQDALSLMGVYEELIYPQIEEQIRDEYIKHNNFNDYNLKASSRLSYYAPKGGMVTYLSPISGYKPTEVSVVCLNRSDSYDFILAQNSFKMSNVIASVLGYVPIIGNISSLVLDIRGIVNQFAITNIRNAGGYAKIVNTYSREWGTKASLVTGWSDRYYIKVPSSAQGISFKGF